MALGELNKNDPVSADNISEIVGAPVGLKTGAYGDFLNAELLCN